MLSAPGPLKTASSEGRGPDVQEEERGGGEGWKGSRGAAGQLCFKRLHAAVRGFLPRAATVIFFST